MDNLFPTFDYPDEDILQETADEEQYKPSVFFDFVKVDFAESLKGKMSLESTGQEAWVQWCMKVCQTQKGAHLAYGEDYGIDYETILSDNDKIRQNELLELEITEALLNDPYKRTQLVKDFEFNQEIDELYISFVIIGLGGEQESIRFSV